jgi:hypothetical protein
MGELAPSNDRIEPELRAARRPSAIFNSPDFIFALAVAVFMPSIVLMGVGIPMDWWTWLGVCIGVVPVAIACQIRSYSLSLGAVTFVYYLTFYFCSEPHTLQDLHGGRQAWEILPHSFTFAHAGPNTRLLEQWLGPLEPQWQYLDHVNGRNLIFSARLPAILDLLPDDEARRQVLMSLTDSTNLLRFHQGLLLTCVHELGYPPGMDAHSWWDKHVWVFQRERDPARAVRIAWGWQARLPADAIINNVAISIQLSGIHCQQGDIRGGGDLEFGLEYVKFDLAQRYKSNNHDNPDLGVNRIVWWPQ